MQLLEMINVFAMTVLVDWLATLAQLVAQTFAQDMALALMECAIARSDTPLLIVPSLLRLVLLT